MTALQPDGIRALIVDDEAPARQRISDLLNQDREVHSLQEAGDGETAVRMILSEKPNLVLLDVQMPELNGLEVIEAVGPENMPLTVFVTAYDQHAIRAFEANALDYLLKPFSDERFEAMLTRVKRRRDDLHLREFGQNVAQVIAMQGTQTRYLDRLAVKTNGITRFVRVKDIEWIEAAGVYVTLHTSGKEFLYRSEPFSSHTSLCHRQYRKYCPIGATFPWGVRGSFKGRFPSPCQQNLSRCNGEAIGPKALDRAH
jgi:two-component system LytT family response regulator